MRYWEDHHSGEVERFGTYRLDATEITDFAARFGGDAGQGPNADRLAPPMLVCGVFMRLLVAHMGENSASMGSPGVDAIDWHQPAQAGDVLSVEMVLLSTRALESRADIGLLKQRAVVYNQRNEAVATVVCNALFRRRGAGA